MVFQGANKCQSVILWAVFSIPTIAVEFVYSLKIKRGVTFTCVNEIEAMYGRSLVHVKVEPRSTLSLTVFSALNILEKARTCGVHVSRKSLNV